MSKQILVNAFNMNCIGHQSSGLWRHPDDRSREYTSLKHWLDLARTMERGLLDGVFLADVAGVYDVYAGSPDAAIRSAAQFPANDPFCLVTGMAAVTQHLGFGITGSIPYEPPYAFARRISTLDHLTNGRVAWNIVTGYLDSAARGIGRAKQIAHDTRYDIAADYMAVMYKLWEGSWEDDAVIEDRRRGIMTDPTKVHRITHQGPYFQLDAIHLCEPSIQRTPVLFQAGTSPKGQQFAAAHAECVFIAAPDVERAAGVVASLRRQTVAAGRTAADVKIFQLACMIVDDTDAAANAKMRDLQRYGLSEGALALMSGWSGADLSKLDIDARAENVTSEAIQSALKGLGARSVREWVDFLVLGGASPLFVGSPSTIVDQMQRWVIDADIDGFNVAYTLLPASVEEFVDRIVPELQNRGIYKTAYSEGSLRRKVFGRGDRLVAPHPAAAYRMSL